jgi:very-short-patch-repair endonuclease
MIISKFRHYNTDLQENANKLRNNMTKAEACIWKYVLRAGLMKGYKFRRQRPVLNYIADFLCPELNLIIEIDGVTHHFDDTIKKDLKKQNDLERYGFRLIRFKDEDVLKNIEGVRIEIEKVIDDIEKSHPCLLRRHPRQRGTGED